MITNIKCPLLLQYYFGSCQLVLRPLADFCKFYWELYIHLLETLHTHTLYMYTTFGDCFTSRWGKTNKQYLSKEFNRMTPLRCTLEYQCFSKNNSLTMTVLCMQFRPAGLGLCKHCSRDIYHCYSLHSFPSLVFS